MTTWSAMIILSIPLQVLPRLTTTELRSNTKKEDPENLQNWRDLPRTLVLTLYQSTSDPQTPHLSWLGLSSCHRSPIYLQLEDWQTQQRITRHNTHNSGHTLHTDASKGKIFRRHSWIVYIVRERKHCPRTQFLTKTGGADCPSNSSSLSLSMSSYSNELDHTLDAAETHDPGQDSLLPSYSLFSFLPPSLLFSSQKQKNVLTADHSPTSLCPLSLPFSLPCTIFPSPPENRLLIFSSSSPLASSRSFFQFSNAVPFSPLRP